MLGLKVTIDSHSGFCFGVEYAIQMAEDYLNEFGKLYCLGDIVHNDEEVMRLQKMGLEIIEQEDLKHLHNVRVLIRAHGEPPETYKLAIENNIELVDASCPVVLKLQHRVRESFEKSENQGNDSTLEQGIDEAPIYIYGKHGHAEVKGLVGQTLGKAVVFQDFAEIENTVLPKKITLFSQTTKDTKNLYAIRDKFKEKGVEVNFNDTICRQVSNRDRDLQTFATQFDRIVFVSGKKSSNGIVLYNVCKKINDSSYFVSHVEDLDKNWFQAGESVGICGATSTPGWLMEDVKTALESF